MILIDILPKKTWLAVLGIANGAVIANGAGACIGNATGNFIGLAIDRMKRQIDEKGKLTFLCRLLYTF